MDNRIIRKATDLADGFTWDELSELGHYWIGVIQANGDGDKTWFHYEDPVVVDAVVAQLVRQVDETEWKVHVYKGQTIICNGKDEDYCIHKGDDRTENTLRAIIDSRILENL